MTAKRQDKPASDLDDLLKLLHAQQVTINAQQEQIDGLQQGYLQIVQAMQAILAEIIRLQRHTGIRLGSVALPPIGWQPSQEKKK